MSTLHMCSEDEDLLSRAKANAVGHDSYVELTEHYKAKYLIEHFNKREYCMFCGTPIIVGSSEGTILEQVPQLVEDDVYKMGIACRDVYACNLRIKKLDNARVPKRRL